METTTPPSSTTISRTVVLVLRVLTFVFLLIALILIAINTETEQETEDTALKVKFNDVYSYRYMISTIVIGFAYNLLQMALSIFSFVSGNRITSGNGGYLFDFYGDKIISYLLATGSAAGFGASKDLETVYDIFSDFFTKAYASASLLLFGFLFTAVASVFSSYALPKKA